MTKKNHHLTGKQLEFGFRNNAPKAVDTPKLAKIIKLDPDREFYQRILNRKSY